MSDNDIIVKVEHFNEEISLEEAKRLCCEQGCNKELIDWCLGNGGTSICATAYLSKLYSELNQGKCFKTNDIMT